MPQIIAPEAPEVALPPWMADAATVRERDRILAARYFLVKIGGNGGVWRCRRCGGKHRYLTLGCVEQPFSGLTRGLYAYFKTVGMHGAEAYLSPAERRRYAALGRMFGRLGSAPDLAASHPLAARAFGTRQQDAEIGAYTFTAAVASANALGIVEPITPAKAADLARRINLRGILPPFTLEGIADA